MADVSVTVAGSAGIWTALRFSERCARTAALEARCIGHAGSSRRIPLVRKP